ncbi:hypothetical protein SS05631_a47430 (plasmid) [Sinorhizobium sp. CCBAU 05631]|nr:hypothetical protein SS05631_a47430 [Sinorhizobium sp. CCBAU 05631]
MAGFTELQSVADSGEQCCRAQCTDPRDRHQSACNVLSIGDRLNLFRGLADTLFEAQEIGV